MSVTEQPPVAARAALVVLVRESLGLWGVDATVVAASGPEQGPVAAPSAAAMAELLRIDGPGPLCLSIAAAVPADEPVRWWLCWHARDFAGNPTGMLRRKPCASTLGLLRTLRESLGIAAGPRVRIGLGAAPGPAP